jgi:hypothetical protein
MNNIIQTAVTLWQTGRKTKRSGSSWISANAVCCIHNNQTQDKRQRGGIIVTNDKIINYSCFNCGFKASYAEGKPLSSRFKQLLSWIGADSRLIDQLTIEALKIREELGSPERLAKQKSIPQVRFEAKPLPEGSVPLNQNNSDHQEYVEYILNRGLNPGDYRYYVTPDAPGRDAKRIIIPYYYNQQVVGNTSRYYDDRKPKYISHQQRGYVFNIDAQLKNWKICILVEGQFDALAIGGCAFMSNTILDEQAVVLERLRRQIIVVPDRDKTGMEVCDRALELGYQVSIPNWPDDIKDVNDAVKKYGRFATLLSIIQSATSSKIKIEMTRKRFK